VPGSAARQKVGSSKRTGRQGQNDSFTGVPHATTSGRHASMDPQSCSTPRPVSTWMGDQRLRGNKSCKHIILYLGRRSLPIPSWICETIANKKLRANMQRVPQCKPVSG